MVKWLARVCEKRAPQQHSVCDGGKIPQDHQQACHQENVKNDKNDKNDKNTRRGSPRLTFDKRARPSASMRRKNF